MTRFGGPSARVVRPTRRGAGAASLVDAVCARNAAAPSTTIDLPDSLVPTGRSGCTVAAVWDCMRIAMRRIWLAATCIALLGCGKSPADQLAEQSLDHLRAAVEMLEANAPDVSKLATASMQYRVKHQGDFAKLRTEGERLLAQMSPAERTAFETRQRGEAVLLYGKLEANAKRYKDERLAMRLVRPLIVSATARPPTRTDGDPPWLPPAVDPPEGMTASEMPPTPGAEMHLHP